MELLTTGQALKELGISRMTLYAWIRRKEIACIVAEAGGRTFFTFDVREIQRVKSRLKTKREKGKSLLDKAAGGK